MNRLPPGTDPREIPTSVLAYIGDAVFELAARMRLAGHFKQPSGALHTRTIQVVCAGAQARAVRAIQPLLTAAEQAIYQRARNHAAGSTPRNADPVEYRMATGLEAVIGYLYLQHQDERLQELLQATFVACETGTAADSGADTHGQNA